MSLVPPTALVKTYPEAILGWLFGENDLVFRAQLNIEDLTLGAQVARYGRKSLGTRKPVIEGVPSVIGGNSYRGLSPSSWRALLYSPHLPDSLLASMENKKTCPHCRLEVDARASRCPHCQGKIYVWTVGRKILAGTIIVLFVSGIVGSFSSNEPKDNPTIAQTVQTVSVSEVQCQELKDEFYSMMIDQPHEKTQLAKEILEQYAFDGGIPVKRSNPSTRYELPNSDCGSSLKTLLQTIVNGEKQAL